MQVEIENNLLLLPAKDARTSYLRRLLFKIDHVTSIHKEQIEYLNSLEEELYQFILHYPNEPRIEFFTAKIDCRLLEYELYEGTRREPKA